MSEKIEARIALLEAAISSLAVQNQRLVAAIEAQAEAIGDLAQAISDANQLAQASAQEPADESSGRFQFLSQR